MCRTKILVFVILMAILLAAELTLTFWVRHRVDHNGQTDFWSGIPMVFLGLQGYFLWRICIVSCFVDDDADNDHHDHGGNSSNNHVIVTIKELAVVNPYALIRSIPVVDFNSRNFEDVKECAVCLSELADGDKTKLLPSCRHWFHAHCIDTWLRLHATCPICRERVCLFQSNKPRSELLCPVEPPAATSQDASSGPADVTAVVVDIPTSPEVGEIGPISAT